MAKNVLFISYDGMCDPLGQSQVIPYLTGLSLLGYQITIISAEKPATFLKESKNIQMLLRRSNIQWKHVEFSNQIPGWSAWNNYLRLKKIAERMFQSESFDLVHCRSYIPAILGLYLKEKFGAKMIFDMRGFWADERVEGNLWSLTNPVYKAAYNFFKKKEIQLLNESDAIVSLTENAKKEMLTWEQLEIPSEKITVIPCCAD
ncbi:MAG: glycosyltransferase, partial [Chitinophagales bacterium]|nr:glycosyltransferase [Chitinophagales bacterium]